MADHGVDLTDPRMLQRTAEHLSACFAGTFFPELVERCVAECYAEPSRTARIHSYLAPIAVHVARDRLRALATARSGAGSVAAEVLEHAPVQQVLFVDDHDTGPAAVAAALLGDVARSRGRHPLRGHGPADTMDPQAVKILANHGVPAPMAGPKPATRKLLHAADWVITLGGQDLGPLDPDTTCQTWPAQTTPEAEQWPAVIADLQARVHALQVEITSFSTDPARTG